MESSKKTKICPRCKGNGYIKVVKEVAWPSKEQQIVVQCSMCNSQGEIEEDNEDADKQGNQKIGNFQNFPRVPLGSRKK